MRQYSTTNRLLMHFVSSTHDGSFEEAYVQETTLRNLHGTNFSLMSIFCLLVDSKSRR